MSDSWEEEGFGGGGTPPGGDDDWDDDGEGLESELGDVFDDPNEPEDEDWDEGEEE